MRWVGNGATLGRTQVISRFGTRALNFGGSLFGGANLGYSALQAGLDARNRDFYGAARHGVDGAMVLPAMFGGPPGVLVSVTYVTLDETGLLSRASGLMTELFCSLDSDCQ